VPLTEGRFVIGFLILFAAWLFIGLPLLIHPSEQIEYRWLALWTYALFVATVGLILATAVLGYFAYRQSRDKKASIAATQQSAEAAAKSANARIDNIPFLRRHLWAISAVALFLIAFFLTHFATSSSEYDFDKNSVVLFGVVAPAGSISTDPIVVGISRQQKPDDKFGIHFDTGDLALEAEFHFRREIQKGGLGIRIGGIADANQCRSVTQRAKPLDQDVSKGDDYYFRTYDVDTKWDVSITPTYKIEPVVGPTAYSAHEIDGTRVPDRWLYLKCRLNVRSFAKSFASRSLRFESADVLNGAPRPYVQPSYVVNLDDFSPEDAFRISGGSVDGLQRPDLERRLDIVKARDFTVYWKDQRQAELRDILLVVVGGVAGLIGACLLEWMRPLAKSD
jgi:hypothetical protein